jgi:hypothetical protein
LISGVFDAARRRRGFIKVINPADRAKNDGKFPPYCREFPPSFEGLGGRGSPAYGQRLDLLFPEIICGS